MFFEGMYHVWYCGHANEVPFRPDITNKWYQKFNNKNKAESYSHDLIKEFSESGVMIEYGIIEVTELQKIPNM